MVELLEHENTKGLVKAELLNHIKQIKQVLKENERNKGL
jgi:hypothetical protein